jgi:hypothetical protein
MFTPELLAFGTRIRAMVLSGGWLYAQAGSGLSVDIPALVKDSIAGACLLLVLTGWLNPKTLVDRQDATLARAEKQRDELAKQQGEVIPVLVMVQQQMLPALKESTEALKMQTTEIAAARAEIVRLHEEIGRLMNQLANRRQDG